jgi:site-specific DNA-cytosine methylase
MNLLELFAGSRSMGKAGELLGMNVYSSDINNFEKIDYVIDIFSFDVSKVPFIPDIIHASPPCQGFSVAAIGKNWVKGEPFTPKTDSAHLGTKLVKKTIEIINHFRSINPQLVFFIENPRGKLRKAPFMEAMPRHTVTYCQYGDSRMKPTDIWTNTPPMYGSQGRCVKMAIVAILRHLEVVEQVHKDWWVIMSAVRYQTNFVLKFCHQ